MEYRYQVVEADLLAAQAQAGRQYGRVGTKVGPFLLAANTVAWIPIGIGLATLFALWREVPASHPHLIVATCAAFAAVVLGYALTAYSRQRRQRAFAVLQGPFPRPATMSVLDDGLHFESEAGISLYRWRSVRNAHRDGGHVFIETVPAAIIAVPRHAFGSPSEADAFVQEVARRTRPR